MYVNLQIFPVEKGDEIDEIFEPRSLLASFEVHGWLFLLVEDMQGNKNGHLESEGTAIGQHSHNFRDYFLIVLHQNPSENPIECL